MEIRGGTLIEWLVVGGRKKKVNKNWSQPPAFLGGYEQKGFDQPTKYWVRRMTLVKPTKITSVVVMGMLTNKA